MEGELLRKKIIITCRSSRYFMGPYSSTLMGWGPLSARFQPRKLLQRLRIFAKFRVVQETEIGPMLTEQSTPRTVKQDKHPIEGANAARHPWQGCWSLIAAKLAGCRVIYLMRIPGLHKSGV